MRFVYRPVLSYHTNPLLPSISRETPFIIHYVALIPYKPPTPLYLTRDSFHYPLCCSHTLQTPYSPLSHERLLSLSTMLLSYPTNPLLPSISRETPFIIHYVALTPYKPPTPLYLTRDSFHYPLCCSHTLQTPYSPLSHERLLSLSTMLLSYPTNPLLPSISRETPFIIHLCGRLTVPWCLCLLCGRGDPDVVSPLRVPPCGTLVVLWSQI